MAKYLKARTPILAIILSLLAIGYTFAANKVVVVPMGGADIPSGAVVAFNSKTCPAGWQKYINLQGRFVVGLNDGGTLGGYRGIALVNNGSISHNHLWAYWYASSTSWRGFDFDGNIVTIMDWGDGVHGDGSGHYPISIEAPTITRYFYTRASKHTPPYVQLLYCEKV